MKQKEDTFEGWDNDSTEDLFKDTDSTAEKSVEDVIEEDDKSFKETLENPKKGSEEDTKSPVENEGEDLFNMEEDKDSEEEPDSDTEVLEYLKEKGLVDFSEEDLKGSENPIRDILDKTTQKTLLSKIESLPKNAQGLIKYIVDGGTVENYLKEVSSNRVEGIVDDMDMDSEENQELVTYNMLLQEGNDEESVKTQIELLKDSGKLESFSKSKYKKWKTAKKEGEEEIIRRNKERQDLEKKKLKEGKKEIQKYLESTDRVGDIPIAKGDVDNLSNYISDRTVKLENGSSITQMQKELHYGIPKNEVAMMQLALLMRNRNEDGTFNFKAIIDDAESKVTRKVRNEFRRDKKDVPNSSAKRGNSNISLASMLS